MVLLGWVWNHLGIDLDGLKDTNHPVNRGKEERENTL